MKITLARNSCRDDIELGNEPSKVTENIDFLQYIDPSNLNDRSAQYLLDNLNLEKCRKYNCRPAVAKASIRNSNCMTPKYIRNYDRDSMDELFLKRRLDNVCLRRMAKNTLGLPHMSPSCIDWDKLSDSTWLYGPRVETVCIEVSEIPKNLRNNFAIVPVEALALEGCDMDSTILTQSVFSDLEYYLDASSIELCFPIIPESTNKRNIDVSSIETDCQLVDSDGKFITAACTGKPILKRTKEKSFQVFEISPKPRISTRKTMRKSVSFNYVVNAREFLRNPS